MMLSFAPPLVLVRWFPLRGAVVQRSDRVEVSIAGTLIGSFSPTDLVARNVILIALASDPRMHLGQLASAFEISSETLRQVRRLHESGGIRAVLDRPTHGGPRKLTDALRARIEKDFDNGLTVSEAHDNVRRKLSRSAVGVVRKDWAKSRGSSKLAAASEGSASTDAAPAEGTTSIVDVGAASPIDAVDSGVTSDPQVDLAPTGGDAVPRLERVDSGMSGSETTSTEAAAAYAVSQIESTDSEPVAAVVELVQEAATAAAPPHSTGMEASGSEEQRWGSDEESQGAKVNVAGTRLEAGRGVQHLGSWMMVAALNAMGLYREVETNYSGRFASSSVRVALDALVIALSIGQRSVEGVRRLATPTARILLRASHAPSASWVRRVLGSVAHDHGGERLQVAMAREYMRVGAKFSDADRPSVFYVDNHLRPYTGDQVIRKGWRMQDKAVRAGVSDYYVHDEDGRPLFRVDVASHDSLTTWLPPIAELLRESLGEDRRILLCFDRAGAFPEHLAELRNESFEFVTYERRPYPPLPVSSFSEALRHNGEVVALHESRLKNLGSGRGRVRRIAFRTGDSGHQVNLLANSSLPAEELYLVMRGRWGQENGFKHGVERWGINQLDGRTVVPYPPETIVPNPARRRLDEALRVERAREGRARRQLARLAPADPARTKWEAELKDAVSLQAEFEELRPAIPKHAPLAETELAETLVQHVGEYKTLIDAVRIACANAESEMACILAPSLPRPAEAKRVIQNLLLAPGSIHQGVEHVTVSIQPAGTRQELTAIAKLLGECTSWKLMMPDDPRARPLRFKLQS